VRDTDVHGRRCRALGEARAIDPTFPRVTIDDPRHTAASLAVSAGADVKAVQRMLGHASAAKTLDTCADLLDDDMDAVSDRPHEVGTLRVNRSPRSSVGFRCGPEKDEGPRSES
jgi:integrase